MNFELKIIMKFSLIFFVVLSQIVFAAPPMPLTPRGLPVKPSDDPFYSAPSGFENTKPGTILKSRAMKNSFGIVVIPEKIKSIHQYLIRSEDSFGKPIAAVTTVFEPHNSDPSKLLSYQPAEDSADQDCAPSYAMQLGASPNSILTVQIEQLFAQAGLNEGWYVVVPDHQGPRSTFVVGTSAGHITLDSIRAALSSGNETGINDNAEVALWGYSGGSVPTGWAAQLQPSYAPEIKLIGSAYGGVVANITHVAVKDIGTLFAGFIVAAINGLSHEYPAIQQLIDDKIFPDKKEKFEKVSSQCLAQFLPYYAFDTFDEYTASGSEILNEPAAKKVMDENNMSLSDLVPNSPVYLYNTKNDEIIPPSDADTLYDKFCKAGVSVEYNQDILNEHITEFIGGGGGAFNWLKDRFNGKETSGCTKKNHVSNALTKEGLSGLGEVIGEAILTLLQKPVGPFGLFSES